MHTCAGLRLKADRTPRKEVPKVTQSGTFDNVRNPGVSIRKLSLYRLSYFPFFLPRIGHTLDGKANCNMRHQRHVDAKGLTSEPVTSPTRNGRDLVDEMDAF